MFSSAFAVKYAIVLYLNLIFAFAMYFMVEIGILTNIIFIILIGFRLTKIFMCFRKNNLVYVYVGIINFKVNMVMCVSITVLKYASLILFLWEG